MKLTLSVAFLLFQTVSFGLGLELLASFDIKSKFKIPNFTISPNGIKDFIFRNDGAFLCQISGIDGDVWIQNHLHEFNLIVLNNGKVIFVENYSKTNFSTTNTISSGIDSGQQYNLQEINRVEIIKTINPIQILKTISPKGFLSHELINATTNTIINKLFLGNHLSVNISNDWFGLAQNLLVKYDLDFNQKEKVDLGNKSLLNESTISEKTSLTTIGNRSLIFHELKDGVIYFYKVTDSDLLSSPNRITLGSSQNGSITATVNNPEQNHLNIQSSTNLIDWNTFKTIQNEPFLEIAVPAIKPKEFIRAIE